jgi:hypothetical protein
MSLIAARRRSRAWRQSLATSPRIIRKHRRPPTEAASLSSVVHEARNAPIALPAFKVVQIRYEAGLRVKTGALPLPTMKERPSTALGRANKETASAAPGGYAEAGSMSAACAEG